jgi:hypothetical protein
MHASLSGRIGDRGGILVDAINFVFVGHHPAAKLLAGEKIF